MNIKKILILNTYLPTLGGGEKHMGDMCKFLETKYKDAVIDILVFNYGNVNVHDKKYITIEDLNERFSIKLERTRIKKLDIKRSINKYIHNENKKLIEKQSEGYDIFINFQSGSKELGRAKFNVYSCMFPPKKDLKNYRDSEKIGMGFCKSYNKFISNSEYTNYWLKEYWPEVENTLVIYPAVYSENEIKDRYKEDRKKNIILSVGRFFTRGHNKKQLELALFYKNNKNKFKDYELHLVGALMDCRENREYVNKIIEISKNENIFIYTNIGFSDLIELYTEAKFFWHGTGYNEDENLMPEKMEHFGITTVEAMSYGVVPIVIKRGGQVEIVNEGISGFFWESEYDCIDKTLLLMSDEKKRKEMAKEAVIRSKCFSLERFYENLEEVFK
jgi:glycosyltransferase involved in cell wall biosynthesis